MTRAQQAILALWCAYITGVILLAALPHPVNLAVGLPVMAICGGGFGILIAVEWRQPR